jgi:hypothetical protein
MYYSLTALWASLARRQARRVPENTDTRAYYLRMAKHRLDILKAREGAYVYHGAMSHADCRLRVFTELMRADSEMLAEMRRDGFRITR